MNGSIEVRLEELFVAQAARTPNAVAVASRAVGPLATTYSELDVHSNRIAHALRAQGVAPGDLVGVTACRSHLLVASILGILKAGAAYVPIDPAMPALRIGAMLEDVRLRAYVSDEDEIAAAPRVAPANVGAYSAIAPPRAGTPRDLAYVLFTSGSTGRPKPVGVEHRSLVNHMQWFLRRWPLSVGQVVLQKTPITFDAAGWEVWVPILAGATLAVAGPDSHRDVFALRDDLVAFGASVLQLVPSLLTACVEERVFEQTPSLRSVFAGGEALAPTTVRAFFAQSSATLTNLYGPTETTIDATSFVCSRERTEHVTIGRPVDGAHVSVVDVALRPVARGELGELLIGGDVVARGYVGRPDLTAERFIPDQLGPPGSRAYRTGDLVRERPDGEFEYAGRVDRQVKIRGQRLELEEIEAVLGAVPGVKACAVDTERGAGGDLRLVGFFVGDLDVRELRAALTERLPEVMIPGVLVSIESFPRLSSGKIDRPALAALRPAASEARPVAAPRTTTEERVCAIFRDVLHLDAVGHDDDFFALGGHSLSATQLIGRIWRGSGVLLPLRRVFEARTVGRIAEAIDATAPQGAAAILSVDREKPLRLSFGQERVWHHEQLFTDSRAYRAQATLALRGHLVIPALERALTELTRRHEVLRTTFHERDGEPYQVVHQPFAIVLPIVEVAGDEGALARLVQEEIDRPFTTTELPLARWSLARVAAEHHVLTHVEHHLLHDGWSANLFFTELAALYRAFVEGKPSPLADLTVQFADVAAWQREWMKGSEAARQLAWWKERLTGAPPVLELPCYAPRPASPTFRGDTLRIELSHDLATIVRRTSQELGVTNYVVLLSTFFALLERQTGMRDLIVGGGIANRRLPESESVVGMLINNVAMRCEVLPARTFRELIDDVRSTVLDAQTNQDVPFDWVVRELGSARNLRFAPIYQVDFWMHDSPLGKMDFPGLEAELTQGLPNGSSKGDLGVVVIPRAKGAPDGFTFLWEYTSDVLDEATVRRLARQYEVMLRAALQDPEARVRDLPMLDDVERRRALTTSTGLRTQRPATTLLALFERSARRLPGSVALTDGQRKLTYAELDARAETLSRRLRALGVGPEVTVGVFLERSVDAAVAVLAVLKAGGAYVPLDSKHPPARRARMIEVTRVGIVLTTQALRAECPVAITTVAVDQPEPAPAAPAPPRVEAGPRNAAVVLHTSGSTGEPKGVVLEHAGLASYVEALVDELGMNESDRVLQFASLGFDVSIEEIFGCWAAGGALVLRSDDMLDPARLLEECGRAGVTVLALPTSYWHQVGESARARGGWPESVRVVCVGGEKLVGEQVVAWSRDARAPRRVISAYGPTEASVSIAWCEAAAWVRGDRLLCEAPLGKPVPNADVYVLDDAMQPVPSGVVGQIYVGGVALARGYAADPAATAARFVPHPWAQEPGARLYATGDRARYLVNGGLSFVGRDDGQVKLRGLRIECAEVEAVLGRCPGVSAAAVIARRDDSRGEHLAAYVVGSDVEADGLRRFARDWLPEYMIPAAFTTLASMPLNANGKLDRAALAILEVAEPKPGEPPCTPLERTIADIWADVLGVRRIGRHDNFFDLGGHSLLVTRIVARLRESVAAGLPLRALFDAPTVAELARLIAPSAGVESELGASSFESAAVVPYELLPSSAQQRLWFLDRYEPGTALYNVPVAWRLRGRLDAHALERSLDELVRRHDTLRATFHEEAGEPRVTTTSDARMGLSVDSGTPGDVAAWVQAQARAPFDLTRARPIRAALLRLGADDHVLALTLHHVAVDGWSMGVLARELGALYTAFSAGRASPLPSVKTSYYDHAARERAALDAGAFDEDLAYWKSYLAGAPPLLELPLDRPRPAIESSRGDVVVFELGAELSKRLGRASARLRASQFMLAATAFAGLLHRYSGQEDLCVGYPVANRDAPELEGVVGLFVNTLVLRCRVAAATTVRDLVDVVRQSVLEGAAHQSLPFERLVPEVVHVRSLGHAPVFQALIGLDNTPETALALPQLTAHSISHHTPLAKFDLALLLSGGRDGLRGELSYRTDLFDRETIERMVGHYRALLEAVVDEDGAERRVSDVAMASEDERRTIVRDWNDTAVPFARNSTIQELFERQVARRPDAIAVVCDGESLTYVELNRRANRLAHRLRALGVGRDGRVGLCLERSLGAIVAIVAVVKAGAAYVPLDPTYPAERLALMQRESRVALVVTERSLVGRLGDASTSWLCIDDDVERAAIAALADTDPPSTARPDDLAYCMFTSGSTGSPKAVGIPHVGVVRTVIGVSYVRLDEHEVILQAAPLAFDASTFEIWGSLLHGGRLVVLPRGNQALHEIAAVIEREHVTTLFLTAALFEQFCKDHLGALRAVRQLVAGGDVLAPGAVRATLEALPECQLVNGYGPTESTTFATCYPFPRDFDRGAAPIGRPIANTEAYVLDAAYQPNPVGVPGDIYLAGPGLARGYLERPDLTADRFIPNPFGAPGSRMYATGDVGRYLRDGNIAFLGRRDQQVKIRGFRIELGEIEAALASCEGVREAVVTVHEWSPGDKRLVAHVVGDAAPQALREALRRVLPDYMIPAAIVGLSALPLNPSGKVDRKALPAPTFDRDPASADYQAARSPSEELISAIFADLLRLEGVSVHDDFFLLGGHSLLAARAVARVREACGRELTLRDFFGAPTVARLAAHLHAARDTVASPDAPIQRARHEGPVLASFAQRRLWFIEQYVPGTGLYNIPAAWRLRGRLDVDALSRAIGAVVNRHESLRTVFANVGGEAHQVVRGHAAPLVSVVSIADGPDLDRPLRTWVRDESERPFDLASDVPIRVAVAKVAEDDHVLVITLHHVAADGVSMAILMRELCAHYGASRSGATPEWSPLAAQYRDYSAWERGRLQGAPLERRLAHWRRVLAGAPPLLDLPVDRRRPELASHVGEVVPLDLDADLSAPLRALARRLDSTPFIVTAAAFAVLLHGYSRQEDICLGYPVAGRTNRALEGMVGLFANTLVLRARPRAKLSFAELVAEIRGAILDADENDLPFELLVQDLRPERNGAYSPIFQAMIAFDDAEDAPPSLPGLELEPVAIEERFAKFDLTLVLHARSGRLSASFEFNTSLFDRVTVERMARHYRTLLEVVIADPDARIATLPRIGADERSRALGEWNDTAMALSASSLVHEQLAARASAAPDATAVVCEHDEITYGGLDARAAGLARHLAALGVGPETPVAVAVSRSIAHVVVLLAIWKAGGVCVPLDVSAPRERIATILDDAGAKVLVSDRATRACLPVSAAALLCIDDEPSSAPAESPTSGTPPTDERSLAYILYTSGSTGVPKGVAVPHAALRDHLAACVARYELTPEDRALQFASTSFDASLEQLFAPLCAGASVVLRGAAPWGLDETLTAIDRHAITVADLPTAYFHALDAGSLATLSRSKLRLLLVGGEAAHGEALAATTPRSFRIVNAYGPTEATVTASTYDVGTLSAGGAQRYVSIGRPLPNTQIYVVNTALEPVPIGVVGEIAIAGSRLARGYWRRPALTAEAFVPNPFGAPGSRLYRTGDLGRQSPSGDVEFIGRIDGQVKVRGFRVELGEIEAALTKCDGVRDAAAIVSEESGDARLVAYVVPRERPIGAEKLRAQLSEKLPGYMIPSVFVELAELPLGSGGKVDRKALPTPPAALAEPSDYVAPRDETEQAVAEIWAEVLGLERLGAHADFFAIGGHSLLAMKAIMLLNRRLGVSLGVREIFTKRTVASFAKRVIDERALPAVAASGLASNASGPREEMLL